MNNINLKKVEPHNAQSSKAGPIRDFRIYILAFFALMLTALFIYAFFIEEEQNITSSTGVTAVINPNHKVSTQADGHSEKNRLTIPNKLTPSITLVVANIGLNLKHEQWVNELPHETVLGFSPYADDAAGLIDKAIKKGYKTVLHVPMLPKSYPMTNLGPYCLLDILNAEENISRLQAILAKSSKIVGVYQNFDEILTESEVHLKMILQEIDAQTIGKERFHFIYYDEKFVKDIDSVIEELLLPRVIAQRIDVAIPDNLGDKEISEQLKYAESIAKSRGGALVLIYANSNYNKILQKWFVNLAKNGINLVDMDHLERLERNQENEKSVVIKSNTNNHH